jgi:eukaryotic-like serine/threonine-protein kinase
MARTEQSTRYREIRRLGTGGMATVTLAEDTVLGRLVALKRVHGAGERREMLRLKREALVGASLNHPNLVFVYDAQLQDDGDVVIVMEYVEGQTLADVIRARAPLSPGETFRVLRGAAAALDAIHDRGIVHRDVKPANVLLGDDGAIKLADLGVADVADRTRITSSGAVVGSFSYMAPEQLDGAEPTAAMDIYALAAVAYEMLSGKRARPESNALALAHAIATQPPPDLCRVWPSAPPAAAAVLERAMSADPRRRPGSAGDFVSRLESAFQPERPRRPAPDRRPLPPPPLTAPRRSSILVPALLVLAVLVLGGAVAAVISSSSANKNPRASASAHRTKARARPTRTASRSANTHTTHASSASTHVSSATSHSSSATSHAPPATSHASSATTPATGASPPTTTASAPAAAPPAPASGASSSGTPVSAVEQFYTTAARHDYATAWALADPNLRSQLGGYAAFQHQFSSVRSITFRRAQALGPSDASTATVSVNTTSVQTSRTQQCSGTARTVRSGASWLVDGISISCS